ncbi:MAG: DUF2330 domain-containing protein [Sandaracinaceae bacterium]
MQRFSFLLCCLALTAMPLRASACGGCFGPTGQPTQVTAHRMAVMFGAESTTLWDQFEYTGAPEDFVWVLPVAGDQDVQIELSSNNFFTSLTSATAITLQAPFRSTGGGGGGGFGCSGAAPLSSEAGGAQSTVTIYGQEVVGPYEAVTLGPEDPDALVTWLQDNGYGVPTDMLPVIESYVESGMNFVALRLSPDETVDRMQPVRITTPGINTAFPLRMVGAGVVGSVALELFVLGEGRYEAANFDNLEVPREQLVYDYATASFNYDTLAQAVLDESAGGGWLTEVAIPLDPAALASVVTADGETLNAMEDSGFVLSTLGRSVYVTRMRAELPRDALREDLVLMASSGNDFLGNRIQVENDVNFGSPPSSEGNSLPVLVLMLLAGAVGYKRKFMF